MNRFDLILLHFKAAGFNGCDIIELYSHAQEYSLIVGRSFMHSLILFQEFASSCVQRNDIEPMKIAIVDLEPIKLVDVQIKNIDHKNQKYIRQQHKYAQRHFRRK